MNTYCLKTGGLILIASDGVYECDLHIQGETLIAVITGSLQYDNIDLNRITIRIPIGADYFVREGTPYGVLVAQTEDVRASESLLLHIRDWYSYTNIRWAR